MAVGNIVYSTSSTTIVSGQVINASNFERSTDLQVDTTTGNLNIAGSVNATGGIVASGTSNLGSVGSVKITGGSNGQVLSTDGSGNLSWASGVSYAANADVQTGTSTTLVITPSTLRGGGLVHRTVQSPTSGTSVEFTSIPSWVKRITVMFVRLATAANPGSLNIQLGTGGVVETTNYFGSFGYTNSGLGAGAGGWDTYMVVSGSDNVGASEFNGSAILTRLSATSNTWICQSVTSDIAGPIDILTWTGAGSKALSGTLDTVRVFINGSSFSSGSINIMYE